MGFFSPSPKITPKEWKLVRERLKDHGLSERNVEDLEALAHQAMKEKGSAWGIDRKEAEEIIKYLRNDRGSHNLSSEEIDRAEKVFEDLL